MKVGLLLTLSFFFPLFAFLTKLPLAFSDDVKQVVDTSGNPIFPGSTYYIMPASFGPNPGGGLNLGKTGNSECPLTVLQGYALLDYGLQVKFKIPGISPGIIFTGTKLEIEFTEKPECAESSKWSVFVDDEIQQSYVGIGGPNGEPGQETISGTFQIENFGFKYKLVFCHTGTLFCLDIERFDADKGEGGRRLILTKNGVPFEVVFVDASKFDGIIKFIV